MENRKAINVRDLNPEFDRSLSRILDELSPIITKEKKDRIEKIIKSQTDYLNNLFEKLRNIGLFINDTKNKKVYPNRYWYDWGYTEKEMMGMGFLQFVHPDDLDTVMKSSIQRVTKGIDSNKVMFRIRTSKGEWRWILSAAVSIIKDKEGNIQQFIGFDMDITEEMEAKEKLKTALDKARKAKKRAELKALEANTMQEISKIVTSTLDLDSTIEAILQQAKRVIPFDTASVQILKNDSLIVMGGTGWPDTELIKTFSFPVPGDNPNTKVVESKEPLIINNIPGGYSSFKNMPKDYGGKSWIGIPLIFREKVIGVLTFDKNEKNFFKNRHKKIGAAFASHVAVALENSRIFEEMKNIALTDPLTGAKNRRAFFDFAIHQDKMFKRYGKVFSLIMIDIDFFKKVNDSLGHQSGDTVLKKLVLLIRRNLRDSDIVCRYGGEEFLILLPSSDENNAFEIAERIRIKAENQLRIKGYNKKITISAGCADRAGPEISSIDSLISMADRALYSAKSTGRNRSIKYSVDYYSITRE